VCNDGGRHGGAMTYFDIPWNDVRVACSWRRDLSAFRVVQQLVITRLCLHKCKVMLNLRA
jgi:hypothetical protein